MDWSLTLIPLNFLIRSPRCPPRNILTFRSPHLHRQSSAVLHAPPPAMSSFFHQAIVFSHNLECSLVRLLGDYISALRALNVLLLGCSNELRPTGHRTLLAHTIFAAFNIFSGRLDVPSDNSFTSQLKPRLAFLLRADALWNELLFFIGFASTISLFKTLLESRCSYIYTT